MHLLNGNRFNTQFPYIVGVVRQGYKRSDSLSIHSIQQQMSNSNDYR